MNDNLKNKLKNKAQGGNGSNGGGAGKPANIRPGVAGVKSLLGQDHIKERFHQMLGDKANGFMASVINVVNNNDMLRDCEPMTVVSAAAVAATLDLPVNPNLGFAAVVPYRSKDGVKAQFQMMYKGFIQLAMRTGQYKRMNATEVYEDELESYNPITGEMSFTDQSEWEYRWEEKKDKVVGYYAYFELLNGFEQGIYMTIDQIRAHADRYSQSYKNSRGPWAQNFHEMAIKTVIKQLLSKWGILSVDMQTAVTRDQAVIHDLDIEDDQNLSYVDNPEDDEEAIDIEGQATDDEDADAGNGSGSNDGEQNKSSQKQTELSDSKKEN